MRRPADVMTDSADDRILEYLSETDFAAPKEIADETSKNNDYIGRRCRILKKLGLVETPGRGLYRITDTLDSKQTLRGFAMIGHGRASRIGWDGPKGKPIL